MRRKKTPKAVNEAFPFKNSEQLALYYCREAGVKNFKDLKDTIYWNYYLEDCKRFHKKIISETEVVKVVKETGVITCGVCGEQLGATIDGFVLLDLNYSFKHHKAPLKILCKCGHQNIFEEITKLKEEDKNVEKG